MDVDILNHPYNRDPVAGLYELWQLIPAGELLGLVSGAIQQLQYLEEESKNSIIPDGWSIVRSGPNLIDITAPNGYRWTVMQDNIHADEKMGAFMYMFFDALIKKEEQRKKRNG